MNVRFDEERNDENKGDGVDETHTTLTPQNQSYTRAQWLIHP